VEWPGAVGHEQVSPDRRKLFDIHSMESREDYCEMKIKEKGLTGAAAINKRDSISRIHGFNAFQETDKGNVTDEKESNHSTKQVYLDFMGKKILIKKDQQGNGTVSAEDVPFVKGATLKFEGCKDVKWTQIKVTSFFDPSNLLLKSSPEGPSQS